MLAQSFATLLALISHPTFSEAEIPLQPTAAWNLEYHPQMCLLSRPYGANDAAVTLAFRPVALGDSVDVVLIGGKKGVAAGPATIRGDKSATVTSGSFKSFAAGQSKQWATTITIERSALEALGTSGIITVRLGAAPAVQFPITGLSRALTAVAKCEMDLAGTWGMKNAVLSAGATRAEAIGNKSDWISYNDYPPDAIRAEQQGTVLIAWTINDSGRVADCKVLASSGSPLLDAAACSAITKRARYKPARDADGKLIASVQSRRVMWSMP